MNKETLIINEKNNQIKRRMGGRMSYSSRETAGTEISIPKFGIE